MMEYKRPAPLRQMTPDQLMTDVALTMYSAPLNAAAKREKAALSDLGMLLLFLDFDAEVQSGGLLGFIENSSGGFLDQTIEMFRRIKATETETVLRKARSILEKHRLTNAALQSENTGRPEYTISTFAERHGARGLTMAEELEKIPGKVFNEPGSTEDAYGLITAFVAERFDSIVSRLEQIEV